MPRPRLTRLKVPDLSHHPGFSPTPPRKQDAADATLTYVERYQIFHENAYDPLHDVEIDRETGLLQWSAAARRRKPELVRRVAEYFERRQEDE